MESLRTEDRVRMKEQDLTVRSVERHGPQVLRLVVHDRHDPKSSASELIDRRDFAGGTSWPSSDVNKSSGSNRTRYAEPTC